MLSKLRAWLYRLVYRFNYREGAQFADRLLREQWPAEDLLRLPELTPAVMPNQAYADGFYNRLHREIHHA